MRSIASHASQAARLPPQNYREDGVTPYFTIWKDGLREVSAVVWARRSVSACTRIWRGMREKSLTFQVKI
jgi:hypothetical protein